MDMFAHGQPASDTAQWLHQLQHAPNTVEPPSTASWNPAQEQNMMAGPSSLQPHTHQHQADMSMGFGDLSNGTTSASPTNGSAPFNFNTNFYPAHYQYTYPETSLSNWNIPPSQPSVPHSSYSSLNGAVTPEPLRRSESVQETVTHHSPPMAIDPSTRHPMQSSSSSTLLHALTPTTPIPSSSSSATPPNTTIPDQQMHFQPTMNDMNALMMLQSNAFNNPSMAQMANAFNHMPPGFTTYWTQQLARLSQHQQVQVAQPPDAQGAMTPQALHQFPSQVTAMPPSSFYNTQPSSSTSQWNGHNLPQMVLPSGASPMSTTSTSAASPVPPPSAPTESPEIRRAKFMSALQPHLQANSFTGAGAVVKLTRVIDNYGAPDVDANTRIAILTALRDKAGNNYFRAWCENEDAMDIMRDWLKAAVMKRDENPELEDTVMPLLQILDRLPMTLEVLSSSKLGKIVVKLVKDSPDGAIKDMASKIEASWRKLVLAGKSGNSTEKDVKEAQDKSKKRKALEPTVPKGSAPKKQATGNATASTSKAASASAPSSSTSAAAVKKKVVVAAAAAPAMKDAKSDSSFFSAPKTKPKLPTFNKRPEAEASVAQPSAINPFQEALAGLTARKASPATAPKAANTPPPASNTPPTTSRLSAKTGKPKKVVTWRPKGELEAIKLIQPAVYEDDHDMGPAHDLRDLDRAEGAAMHMSVAFEESIDWSEPLELEIPPGIECPPRGENSEEKLVQAERENTAGSIVYMTAAQIPDTPTEPPSLMETDENMGKETVIMEVGKEIEDIAGQPMSSMGPNGDLPMPAAASVGQLLNQLAASGNQPLGMGQDSNAGPSFGGQTNFQGFGLDSNLLQMMQNLPPEQLQALVGGQNAFGQNHGAQPPPPMYNPSMGSADGDEPWTGPLYGDGGGGDWEADRKNWDDGGYGRGGFKGQGRGRGGGRPTRRVPCHFFAQGRCRKGDDCNFAHEIPGQY